MSIDMGSATQAPRALVVHAHPEPESFSAAQMRAAVAGLLDAGYHVDVVDLYLEEFSPVLHRREFGSGTAPGRRFKPSIEQERAFREGTLADDVSRYLTTLMRAERVILSFPLWWYSAPAILKGWLDRVLIPGAVFGEDQEFETAALHGARAQFLITTGVEVDYYGVDTRYGDIGDLLLPITRSLEYVGLTVDEPVVTWRPTKLSPEDRSRRLTAVASDFRKSARVSTDGDV